MAKINLRPWREELRAEKQKQFVVMVVGAAIIAGGLTYRQQHCVSAIPECLY